LIAVVERKKQKEKDVAAAQKDPVVTELQA
jgi:hypothetical protein